MDEAERAKQIIMFNEGKIIQQGSYNELVANAQCKTLVIETGEPLPVMEKIKNIPGIRFLNQIGNTIQILADAQLNEEQIKTRIAGLQALLYPSDITMETLYINAIQGWGSDLNFQQL